jgi:hypothetical protein
MFPEGVAKTLLYGVGMHDPNRSSITARGAYRSLQYHSLASFTTDQWVAPLRMSSTLLSPQGEPGPPILTAP